ncbi:hypothetical protein ACFQX7_09380 [Luedemannella flava]
MTSTGRSCEVDTFCATYNWEPGLPLAAPLTNACARSWVVRVICTAEP